MPNRIGVCVLLLSALAQSCLASTDDPHSMVAKAEKLSSLAGPGAQPFHLRLTISEPANSNSQYAATVEEYWKTAKDWTRSINSPEKMDPSSSLPDLPAITKADSISVEPASISQETFEKLLREPLNVVWPPVHSGNTSGKLSIYISADRESNIREAYPLNPDNAGLQDAARDQCRCWDGSGRKRHELRGGSVPEPLGLAQALGQEL
jgi:hypothetical protein